MVTSLPHDFVVACNTFSRLQESQALAAVGGRAQSAATAC